ncbi:MAG: nuclear transport factor 2 family protein, partial [Dehalococcoidales bacterium]
MKADEATRKAVNEVLARMAEAMAAKDINAFIKLFSKDPNILTITPEEEGMYIGPTQLKEGMEKTFNEAESLSLKYGWTSIRANGPVAWVSSHVYYNIKKKGKQEVSLSARMTGVLE